HLGAADEMADLAHGSFSLKRNGARAASHGHCGAFFRNGHGVAAGGNVSSAAPKGDSAARIFCYLAAAVLGSTCEGRGPFQRSGGKMKDVQHAVLLIRERVHKVARRTASSAARSYCALAALVLLAAVAAPCVPAQAADPLAVLREDNPTDPKQGKRYV